MVHVNLSETSKVSKSKLEQLFTDGYITTITEDIAIPGLLKLASEAYKNWCRNSSRKVTSCVGHLCGKCYEFRRTKKITVKNHILSECQGVTECSSSFGMEMAKDMSPSKQVESMEKLQHFIPYLKRNIEKLEKRKKESNNAEVEKKLMVVNKYLHMIENKSKVPSQLAQRIENALNEIYGNVLKNGLKLQQETNTAVTVNVTTGESTIEPKPSTHKDVILIEISDKSVVAKVNSDSNSASIAQSNNSKMQLDNIPDSAACSDPHEPLIDDVNFDSVNEHSHSQVNLPIENQLSVNCDTAPKDATDSKNVCDAVDNSCPSSGEFSPIVEACGSLANTKNTDDSVAQDDGPLQTKGPCSPVIKTSLATNCVEENSQHADDQEIFTLNQDPMNNICIKEDEYKGSVDSYKDGIVPEGQAKLPCDDSNKNKSTTSQPVKSLNSSTVAHNTDDSSSVVSSVETSRHLCCPLCVNIQNVTEDALRNHLSCHAGYQPCSCSTCTGSVGDNSSVSNLGKDPFSHCTNDVKLEEEILNVLKGIISECRLPTTKRMVDCEEMERKRIKLNNEVSISLSSGCGQFSFSEDIKNAVRKLEERKNDNASMISPSSPLLNEVDGDLSVVDVAINENLQVKMERDENLGRINPQNISSYGMTDHLGNLVNVPLPFSDQTLPFHITNVKIEQPDFDDSSEDVMNSSFFESLSSMATPKFTTPKRIRKPITPSSMSEYLPYECSFCGLCYKSLSTYRLHTYRHFKDYFIYRCNYCFRGFMRKDHVKAHTVGSHPMQEIKFDTVDPPDDPVILLTVPKPRNSAADVSSRLSSVVETFKCEFCDYACIPGELTAHFETCHPNENPQMRILKDNLRADKIIPLPVQIDSKPSVKKVVAKKSTSTLYSSTFKRAIPIKKCVAFKSTSKRIQNSVASSSSTVSKIDPKNLDLNELKIWIHSRSIYVSVKDLMKMFNMKCCVRLMDLKKLF